MPRVLAAGLIAAPLIAWSWLRLEDGAGAGEAAVVVLLALLPGLVPGRWKRTAASALAFLVAGSVAWDLGAGRQLPRDIFSQFGRGFAEFYDVQVPFSGIAHPRMHGVLLMAVFVFTLAVTLAAAASRPGLASFALVVGVGWPATLLPGHDLLRGGLLLAGVLAIVTLLRHGPLRGLGAAAAAGVIVVLAAIGASTSPALAKQAFLDWQRWDLYTKPAKPVDVSYVWDSSYSGLTFRGKPTTVLKIEADKTQQYWRATVLDTVADGQWIEEPAPELIQPEILGEDGLIPEAAREKELWKEQRVKVEALRDVHLVGRSEPVSFEPGSGVGRVTYDPTGIALADQLLGRGDAYTAWSYSPSPRPGQLAASKPIYPEAIVSRGKHREIEPKVYPRLFGRPSRDSYIHYLLTDYDGAWRIRPYEPLYELARTVAGGAKSPYAAAVSLESWFRVGGGFVYDQHPSQRPRVPPLVDFVTRTKRGYCQHFAGAMALMLRYLGIPSRVAAGFTSGHYDKDSGTWTVSDRDAHMWVEVWFRGYGWLPFDPTPSRGGGVSGPYSTSSPSFDLGATTAVLAGKAGLSKWATLANQLGFGGPARVSPDVPQLGATPGVAQERPSRAWGFFRLLVTALGGLVLLIALAKLVLRRAPFLTRDPRRLAAACRRELRDFLLDQGMDVPRSATLRELAGLVEDEFGVRAGGFGLHATAARFGPPSSAREAARAMRRDLRDLRKELRRELTWLERTRGLVSLRSLGLAG
jgi:protein-glutamine gamma-glutamyltransferase